MSNVNNNLMRHKLDEDYELIVEIKPVYQPELGTDAHLAGVWPKKERTRRQEVDPSPITRRSPPDRQGMGPEMGPREPGNPPEPRSTKGVKQPSRSNPQGKKTAERRKRRKMSNQKEKDRFRVIWT